MKNILLVLLFVFCQNQLHAQSPKGKVVTDFITSASLKNDAGENTTRRISVYLPPGYEESKSRYPVIYYLHGFGGNDSVVPAQIAVLDAAIAKAMIKPFIFVIPNQYTLYDGTFYSNSEYEGNWADFTGKDLVAYIDSRYRTIAQKESRGIAGHSMGGHGAVKMGILFPDVYGCAYALSPALLGLHKELGPEGDVYRKIAAVNTKEELQKVFMYKVVVALGRTWSPNPQKPPFYCDLPYYYNGDQLMTDSSALKRWQSQLPLTMTDGQLMNLKKLKALKLDWGRNDSERLLVPNNLFSRRLEKMGIEHYAEEYIGNHFNKLWTDDGRILNDMLPFFSNCLVF